jgi:hypothetical protein
MLSGSAVTKTQVRFRAGYIMRPPKGWLAVVDNDFDEIDGPPRMRPEIRERMYQQQLRQYMNLSNDLGADPDPQIRKVM